MGVGSRVVALGLATPWSCVMSEGNMPSLNSEFMDSVVKADLKQSHDF